MFEYIQCGHPFTVITDFIFCVASINYLPLICLFICGFAILPLLYSRLMVRYGVKAAYDKLHTPHVLVSGSESHLADDISARHVVSKAPCLLHVVSFDAIFDDPVLQHGGQVQEESIQESFTAGFKLFLRDLHEAVQEAAAAATTAANSKDVYDDDDDDDDDDCSSSDCSADSIASANDRVSKDTSTPAASRRPRTAAANFSVAVVASSEMSGRIIAPLMSLFSSIVDLGRRRPAGGESPAELLLSCAVHKPFTPKPVQSAAPLGGKRAAGRDRYGGEGTREALYQKCDGQQESIQTNASMLSDYREFGSADMAVFCVESVHQTAQQHARTVLRDSHLRTVEFVQALRLHALARGRSRIWLAACGLTDCRSTHSLDCDNPLFIPTAPTGRGPGPAAYQTLQVRGGKSAPADTVNRRDDEEGTGSHTPHQHQQTVGPHHRNAAFVKGTDLASVRQHMPHLNGRRSCQESSLAGQGKTLNREGRGGAAQISEVHWEDIGGLDR